jgi:hypothetical protein
MDSPKNNIKKKKDAGDGYIGNETWESTQTGCLWRIWRAWRLLLTLCTVSIVLLKRHERSWVDRYIPGAGKT